MNWGKTQLAYLGEKGPKRLIEEHQKDTLLKNTNINI